MEIRSLASIAEVTGGSPVGPADTPVGPDVVLDSRQVTPGALFLAFAGERVDGHDYLAAAREAGAGAALVQHQVDDPLPQVVVGSSTAGLSELARTVVAAARADGLRTVAITGSSGKTSTKDLIAAVLESGGETISPKGSFNNEIGVPLTALRVRASTRFLVSEMGARGIGHVAWLCTIVPPDVSVVLNVGHAHVGEFGSQDAIAQAKGEIVEALPEHGWAILNDDDPRVAAMASRTRARILRVAVGHRPTGEADGTVWAEGLVPSSEKYAFTLHAGERTADVRLRVVGRHQVANAVAAAGVGLVLGLDLDDIANALSQAEPRSKWRMEVLETPDDVLVVNDAYNANPDSMAAALATLEGLRRPEGRVAAVLGDMLELGNTADAEHRRLGALAVERGVDFVIAVGRYADAVLAGVGDGGGTGVAAEDAAGAVERLREFLSPGDVVLVKASRGIALERVAEELAETKGERR